MSTSSLKFIPPIKQKSFFSLQVRTGSLIIGFLGLALSLLVATMFLALLLTFSFKAFKVSATGEIVFIAVILSLLGFAGISFMLIQGIQQNKPALMYFWIYPVYVFLLISFPLGIIAIWKVIISMFTDSRVSIILEIYSILRIIAVGALKVYCFMTVVSHCQDVKRMEEENESLNNNQRLDTVADNPTA